MSELRRGRTRRGGLPARYRVAALVLLLAGVLCLLVELQSSSLIFWTGERVQGTNDGGIAYYTVAGQQRTLDAGDPPARPLPVTVYADPDDPTKDRLLSPAKWFDAAFLGLPFAAAGVVTAVGLVRGLRPVPPEVAAHGVRRGGRPG